MSCKKLYPNKNYPSSIWNQYWTDTTNLIQSRIGCLTPSLVLCIYNIGSNFVHMTIFVREERFVLRLLLNLRL